MTLPLQTGLDRETEHRLNSHLSAHRRAPVFTGWSTVPLRWTWDNVLKLVALVAVGMAVVVGVALWGWSVGSATAAPPVPPTSYSVDTATPRGALGAYFVALDRGDEKEAVDLLCRSAGRDFDEAQFLVMTAAPLNLESVDSVDAMEPWPVRLGDAKPLGDGRYVVDATNSTGTTGRFVLTQEGDGYRVCGFA